jgi:phosphate:Na+ symporter
MFKVLGVILVLPFLSYFADIVGLTTADPAHQVANAHTLFNIGIAIVFLPFTKPFTRLVKLIMPDTAAAARFGPRYLDPLVLGTPTLALAQATRESLRTSDIVREMLVQSIRVFERSDIHLLERLEERDDDVDLLDRETKLYLTKLSRESLTEVQASREFDVMLFTNNMENIGDVIDKNLMELARKKIRGGLSFSRDGFDEIRELHARVIENFDLGVAAFSEADVELARRLVNSKARFNEMERDLRGAHIKRLQQGLKESIDTSSIHLDVLTNFKRINSYIANTGFQLLEREKKKE